MREDGQRHRRRRPDRDESAGRARRREPVRARGVRGGRSGRGPGAAGIAAFVLIAGLVAVVAWAGSATGSAAASRCGSCHATVDVVDGAFSHERHQAGRDCASCHGEVRHGREVLLRAKLGVAANGSASPAAAGLRAPADSKPSVLEGHVRVSCSTCHDMASASCGQCHQPPKKDHFGQRCASCHSPARPFSEPRLTHPTFGAHKTATEACDSCHRAGPEKPSCRSCHGQGCGKGVTTMTGCLKCHKDGTTGDWLEAER